jgi:molybdate transport system substrate-binding protein
LHAEFGDFTGRVRRTLSSLAIGLALALGLSAGPSRADEVTIFAAASTKDAVEDLAGRFMAAGGGPVRTVFAASSTLAKQIAQGAPADIYLSANPSWMDYLAERDVIDAASRVDLLGNRLVLIVSSDGDASSADLGELSGTTLADFLSANLPDDRPLAIADPSHVPAGIYAKAALEALGLWQGLADRAARTADVRAALALVDRGEAPVGIVYGTDARISPRVKVAGWFPAGSHPPIVYPLALAAGSTSDDARRFYDYLRNADSAAVFRSHGFQVPPEPAP